MTPFDALLIFSQVMGTTTRGSGMNPFDVLLIISSVLGTSLAILIGIARVLHRLTALETHYHQHMRWHHGDPPYTP